jgi:hypothetical protein
VEVRVTNPDQSGAPLNYLSWNQTPAKATSLPVLLVDSEKHPLSLVPKAKFSDPARREAPLRLAPGQGITDLLVFEAPAGEFEHLAGAAGRSMPEPGGDPAAVPPPGPPMPREETILDLKKQIEDAAKKTKAEKAMEQKKRDEAERTKDAANSNAAENAAKDAAKDAAKP